MSRRCRFDGIMFFLTAVVTPAFGCIGSTLAATLSNANKWAPNDRPKARFTDCFAPVLALRLFDNAPVLDRMAFLGEYLSAATFAAHATTNAAQRLPFFEAVR